ncbi:MAG TPA: CBS domain-containing protein, partial [Campylobacterales bacterium]|nr:CBS domain-containing protein [Campylobacterales bacterium]
MNNHKNILLKSTSTIREALNIIDSGAMRIALVTDNDEKLIGTLTDGDIRRGILNNLDLSDSIESIIFRTPTVCNVSDN